MDTMLFTPVCNRGVVLETPARAARAGFAEWESEDSVALARRLKAMGALIIDCSTGGTGQHIHSAV